MAKKQATETKYIAKRQLIYPHATTGEEVKVEIGEAVKNMSESSLALEIKAGNVVKGEPTTEEQS